MISSFFSHIGAYVSAGVWRLLVIAAAVVVAARPYVAHAAEGVVPVAGDNAWVLTATALVLFMTLPGLALFYGGLVQARSFLSVLMHCFTICCIVSLLWLACAYSLAFGDGGALQPWIGGLERVGFGGLTASSGGELSESIFSAFQMTFAIITPALVVGAWVERMTFKAVLAFTFLFTLLVYVPVVHWVWGGGWLAGLGLMDFAGGVVVHTTAGVAALVLAAMLRPRMGFSRQTHLPHAPGLALAGGAMLWVGWYGFNAGSALTASGEAGLALLATHCAASAGALAWMFAEWRFYGKPTLVGAVTGAIAGLATVTPASGFITPLFATFLGALAGLLCLGAVTLVKQRWRIDDSLDVFAVHGVGGILGTLLTAVGGAAAFGGSGLSAGGVGEQFMIQAVGVAAVALWTAAVIFVGMRVFGFFSPLAISEEEEIEGADLALHGEKAYQL